MITDLHNYDFENIRWTDLTAAISGFSPAARDGHGLASVAGKLYVHAGYGVTGGSLDHSALSG